MVLNNTDSNDSTERYRANSYVHSKVKMILIEKKTLTNNQEKHVYKFL